jgi:hypothetical protein
MAARAANLVRTLARHPLLNRIRLEALVLGGDLNGQTIDKYLCHHRFPPGAVRVTDGSKCLPQLVDQGSPGHGRISAQLGLGHDRRYSPEVSNRPRTVPIGGR